MPLCLAQTPAGLRRMEWKRLDTSIIKSVEYLNCHHKPCGTTYSCTCSSSIRDTHDTIGELQTSGCPSRAFLLSKSPEGVQTQTDIPEGWDRSWGYRKGLQHGEAGSFLMAQNSVLGGQPFQFPSPTLLHSLNCLADTWHTSHRFLNNTECVHMTYAALRPFYSHKELIRN